MRLVHAVAGVGEPTHGPSYSVPALCGALADLGHDVELHSAIPGPSVWPYPAVRNFVHPKWSLARRFCISPRMSQSLRESARRSAVMHSHGLWTLPNIYPLNAVSGTECRLVVSPRGTLAPAALAFSRHLKQLVWLVRQRRVLDRADCLHATSMGELAEIRDLDLRAPVAVVPNGIDLPSKRRETEEPRDEGLRRVLFLSRIHPKKGLDKLISVWARVAAAFPNWELVIAGPDNGGYLRKIQIESKRLGCRHLYFHPPVFGEQKRDLFRSADVFVYPTRSENFGLVVAEALAHGVPVISTQGAPWPGLIEHGCGWWVDNSEEALEAALRKALVLDRQTLREMGERGSTWMSVDFAWPAVASQIAALYAWLTDGGDRPSFVFP
jgi:glycosyltransferase involved in cell wall biosynthesis